MTIIHSTAIVEDGAKIGNNVSIGPYCFVGCQVELKDGVNLVSHVWVGGDTVVGFTKPGNGWPESDREQQCQNADEQIINL